MPDRGVYRGIYSALPDDLDFQRLTPNTRLVLYTARICREAGPAVIFRCYHEVLARQTGLSVRAVRAAIAELVEHQWAEYEEPVLWIRNGLRYDPYMHLSNGKQRASVLKAVSGLPKLQIVLNFCNHYDLPYPFDRVSDRVSGSSPSEYRVPSTEEDRVPSTDSREEPNGYGSAPPPQAAGWQPLSVPPQILERVPQLAQWPTVEALVALWNDHARRHGYPLVDKVSPARRAKAKAALRAFPDWRFWNGAFSRVKLSRFLSGKTAPTNGHRESFRADFDWFLAKNRDGTENVVKVDEGRYNDAEYRP